MADDTYTVTRSIDIDAPPERVHPAIADFRRWVAWSPWEDLDPQLQRTYSGAESGAGAVYDWSGNRRAGKGRMEILESTEPSRVRIAVRFDKPFKATNDTRFDLTPEGTGTRVTWTMTGHTSLATRVMGLFRSMDAFLGPDFEKGLTRLKTATETPAR